MIGIKKFLLIIISLICGVFANTFALEEVNLLITEVNTIQIPQTSYEIMQKEKELKDALVSNRENMPNYFEPEEDTFENKAGRILSKFINDKAVNNKINTLYSEVETKYLDEY